MRLYSNKRGMLLALCALFYLPTGYAQQCGQPYQIVSGDTLSGIAGRLYQNTRRWLEIYEYRNNSAVIGSNPNQLSTQLEIELPPCDGAIEPPSVTPLSAEADSQPAPTAGAASSSGFIPTIEFVTGGDYAPFTEQSAPGGGMLTQVVAEAMSTADLPNEFNIDFINDWGSHLNILLPKGKYDFAFPWFRPDCNEPSALPGDMQIRCEYLWSEPLYTVSIAFYAPANIEDPPTEFSQLSDKRICRPAGYFTFDLAAHGLFDGENLTLVRPATVAGCFQALESGTVDFVSLNRFTAEKAIANADLIDLVRPIETLVTVLELHLVAHQDDTTAAYQWMNSFNLGLRAIQENGLYDQIVNYHLQKHRQELSRLTKQ